jgi:hypothetical protein
MALGLAERQGRLGNVAVARCEAELPERSVYRLLHAERNRLFPDELFADLYIHHGRRSVPPSILAVVMVLQRLEGCSDREAVDRSTGSPMTCAGGTPPGSTTRCRGLRTWSWWSCAPGCAAPLTRTGSSG